ncbi:DUF2490 domain-containing protein, partial [Candidatus Omnitrophota bacterium]
INKGMKVIAMVIITGFLFSGTPSVAFDDGDFQQWSTISVTYKVNDDWKVTGEQEVRWGDDWDDFYYTHTDLGIVYGGVADWLDLGVNYREVYEEKSKNFVFENRPHFNVTLKTDIEGWALSDRSRLEYRDKETDNNGWRYRNKLTLKAPFKLTKFEIRPYVADEVFVDLDAGDLNRNRVYGGVGCKLMEHVGAELYYLWQASENSSGDWVDYHALGAKLKFSF